MLLCVVFLHLHLDSCIIAVRVDIFFPSKVSSLILEPISPIIQPAKEIMQWFNFLIKYKFLRLTRNRIWTRGKSMLKCCWCSLFDEFKVESKIKSNLHLKLRCSFPFKTRGRVFSNQGRFCREKWKIKTWIFELN